MEATATVSRVTKRRAAWIRDALCSYFENRAKDILLSACRDLCIHLLYEGKEEGNVCVCAGEEEVGYFIVS